MIDIIDTPYAIYRLLKVKRIGFVSANKILSLLHEKKIDPRCLTEIGDEETEKQLRAILNPQQISELRSDDQNLRRAIQKINDQNGGFLTINSPQYPSRISQGLGKYTPPVLSYRGNVDLLSKRSVGFCGSRKASEKGLNVAVDCAEQLVSENVVVVSGYAAGVDRQTHFSALASGGSTIIVLPEGIMNFSIRRELSNVWDWSRVLVISEFLPNEKWSVSRAMQRNKTIIGLSCAMILIEARAKGGSMDAGRKTLAMSRQLFAPVYDGMPSFAEGNSILIKHGAISIQKNKVTGKANLTKVFQDMSCSYELEPMSRQIPLI